MVDNNFFEISKDQSKVKTTIVSKYFIAWANVIMGVQDRSGTKNGKIAYIDLFAGPGRYNDGTKSTPLMILEKSISDEKLRNRLVCIFNDKDEANVQSLQKEINNLSNCSSLIYQPKVYNKEIGTEIVKMFEEMRLIPTFFFVDPWGYKGLSLKLIDSVLKNWGCDCVFFFNYNRINMGLTNALVEEHLNALFGEERAKNLRKKVKDLDSDQRELTIVEELCQAIKQTGKKYVLPFRFKAEGSKRTSHHLIFVSKDFKGYEIMKEVMYKESTDINQGVASFEYNPASQAQPFLFQFAQPLNDLENLLLEKFSGQTKTMEEAYKEHNVDTPYIKKNYKDALMNLEKAEKISTQPNMGERRKGTFGDTVKVTFPKS